MMDCEVDNKINAHVDELDLPKNAAFIPKDFNEIPTDSLP